ncbi:MAG: hypothetical protein AAFQ36_07070 [Pseudomonadota bacterium]
MATDPSLPVIAGFWTQAELSWLEQLSIRSFLDAGHRYVLYSYHEIAGVPEGVEQRDARSILSASGGLIDRRRAVFHADHFRLSLLRKTRFVWADLDMVCIRPLMPHDGYLLGFIKEQRVGNSVMALPSESPALAQMLSFVTAQNPIPPWVKGDKRAAFEARIAAGERWDITALPWGMAGPKALTYFLAQSGETPHVSAQPTYYPVGQGTMQHLLDPSQGTRIAFPQTKAVHVFGYNRQVMADLHHGLPPAGSWLDLACQKHGIVPQGALITPLKDDLA